MVLIWRRAVSNNWRRNKCALVKLPLCANEDLFKCGIVGIAGANPVNQSIYDALTVLQHRGQDAAEA